jgi:hypothetical protein
MKYRKKPVVIEAFRFTGHQSDDVPNWMIDALASGVAYIKSADSFDRCLFIQTLEGTMQADPGDYVICGIKGEIYPCKPDIFESSYEKAEDAPKNTME